MVHTLERVVDTAASSGEEGPGEVELPTNRLNSAVLQEAHIPDGPSAECDPGQIDWVRTLTSVKPDMQHFADEEPDPPPAPSGMGHHITGPARMVSARKSRIPGSVVRALIAFLLVAGIGGAISIGVYTLVDSGLAASSIIQTPATTPSKPSSTLPAAVRPGSSQVVPQREGAPLPPSTTVPAKQAAPQPVQSVVTGNPADMRDKGIEQYKLGNFDAAISLLEGVVSAGSNDARTYYHLGLAYLAMPSRKYSLDDAELAFRTAVSLDPTWAAAHNMLAESLIRRGYYAQAIPQALEATRLDPSSSDAWMTLSRAYKGAGQEAEATRAYAQAVFRAPAPPGP